MLFIGFPQYVETALQKFPSLQQRVEAVATHYLKAQKGEELIGSQVDVAVNKYLIGESGQEKIRVQTEAYLKGTTGSELVVATVTKHMKSKKVTDEIKSAVNKALKSFNDNLSGQIQHRLNDLVSLTESYDKPESLAKGNLEMLENFIRETGPYIIESKKPLALIIVIGKEIPYSINVIRDYTNRLMSEFKDQFRYILILNEDENFLALIKHKEFTSKLNQHVQEEFLNKTLSREAAQEYLKNKFDPKVTLAVQSEQTFFKALTMAGWKGLKDEEEIAVIDSRGKFKGVTSWNRLIDGLVG
jgi:hypothetical protein